MSNIFGPYNANESTTRPDDPGPASSVDTFFQPCQGNLPGTGTKFTARWANKITATLRRATRGMGIADDVADDDLLLKAIQAADKPLAVRAPMILVKEIRSGSTPWPHTQNAWSRRKLNTLAVNQASPANGVSLTGEQLTVPAGTYRARMVANFQGTDTYYAIARLQDITNGVTRCVGTECYFISGNSITVLQQSLGSSRFVLTNPAVLELQAYAAGAVNIVYAGSNAAGYGGDRTDSYLELIKES